MIKISNPQNCCGCTACKSICPKKAISMEPDALGFLYPKVNEDLCINCGLCEKICSFNDHYETPNNFPEPQAFGVRHKDIHEVETSRSGAAFIALSDWILEQGGVVYGAGFVDHFRVAHKKATTKQKRDEFKGSKYVQSDLGSTFSQVRKDLQNGLIVMYSGTACQIAGLKSFIGEKLAQNLYLVDIVCHGAPSPYIWRAYLAYIEKKHGKTASFVNFRDKSHFGWKDHKESVTFEDGSTIFADTYTYLFYSHIMFRKSCGICHFTNTRRPSDITISDFWGWEKTDPKMNEDNKGCSLVLCNTPKGSSLFKTISNSVESWTALLENCIQPNMEKPSSVHNCRNKFETEFNKKGFNYTLLRYGNVGPIFEIRKIWWKVKRIIRKVV